MNQIRIVLVGTTHAGNIGATARAMKTMGLSSLHLVAPKTFPSAEATARAAGADDLLAAAVLHSELSSALAGCFTVFGTTARERRIGWPSETPRSMAEAIVNAPQGDDVAIVFGRERSGLTNEELDLCQRSVMIPTSPDFHSLNLAQAVQICAYEIRLATMSGHQSSELSDEPGDPAASADEVAALHAHWLEVMAKVGYLDPARPKLLARRLRRFLVRANLRHSESQIMRGFLSATEKKLDE